MVTAQLFVLLHALGHVSVGDIQTQAVQEAGDSQVSVGQAISDKIFPPILFQEACHLFTELWNCLIHEFAHHTLLHAFILLLVAVDKGVQNILGTLVDHVSLGTLLRTRSVQLAHLG